MHVSPLQLDEERFAFLERFDFARVEPLEELEGGMFSRPLLLDADGQRYLLREHRFRPTRESFAFQAESLAFAAKQGIACSQVVRLADGSWSRRLRAAPGVLALHEYVEGKIEDWNEWHERKDGSPAFLPELGRQVALLHNALRRASPAGEPDLAIEFPPIQFGRLEAIYRLWNAGIDRLRNLPARSQPARILLQLRPRIDEHWQALLAAITRRNASLPRQIVHGDVSPVNLVLQAKGGWAFIDWDCVHVGSRIYDALGDVLNRPPLERPDLNRFRMDHVAAYLEGYESAIEEPLTPIERDLVPAFCVARQLEDLRQRVHALSGLSAELEEPYAELIMRRVEMMDQISVD